MGKIFIKSFKDFARYIVSNTGAFMFTIIIPTVALLILKREIDLIYIKEYIFVLLIFLIIVFIFFFSKRLLRKISRNEIHVTQISSNKNPKDKILLKIKNDNDEDFTKASVELMAILVEPIDILVQVDIKSDKKYFSTGLKENDYIIFGNRNIEIEIAENIDGVLKLLLDDEAVYEELLNMPENKKLNIFSLIIKVSGNIEEIGDFSHLYKATFKHYIDEKTKMAIGSEKSKFFSRIAWIEPEREINPIKDQRILELGT